jgi:very-short-patch-repair endonuclease
MSAAVRREWFGSSSPCKGEDRWGSAVSRFSRTSAVTAHARRLRRASTKAERKLWSVLQRAQMSGFSFRRQHPIGDYVVDFYCTRLRLAVEVDGGQHNFQRQQISDERRTRWLQAKGVTVLRFWNNEVMENIEGVWAEVAHAVALLSSRSATPTPTLPLSGGGQTFGEVDR